MYVGVANVLLGLVVHSNVTPVSKLPAIVVNASRLGTGERLSEDIGQAIGSYENHGGNVTRPNHDTGPASGEPLPDGPASSEETQMFPAHPDATNTR